MNRELQHILHPWRQRLLWAGVYVALTGVALASFYLVVNRIRTYTIPTGSVELSVPYSKYLVGETVSFTVRNNFNSAIYVNNGCPGEPLSVYKYDGSKWVRIHDTTSIQNCSTQDRTVKIPAHQNMTATFARWPHLFATPGKYRLVMQVQFYNALPHQDFEVITPPPIPKPAPAPAPAPRQEFRNESREEEGLLPQQNTTTNTAAGSRVSQTITVYVTSAGNYSPTNISMHTGDVLRIVYQKPYGDEVITSFSPLAGTSSGIASVTVDSERTSRSITMTSAGSWRFAAVDHNGNAGILTIST